MLEAQGAPYECGAGSRVRRQTAAGSIPCLLAEIGPPLLSRCRWMLLLQAAPAGDPVSTSWDPGLAAAMSAEGHAAYGEAVGDQLLADLAAYGPVPTGRSSGFSV